MDARYERVLARAVTIDEVLSDAFEPLPGQDDTDLAARRLAAWCRSSAAGDWSLFVRRLDRDGLSISDVRATFGTVRRRGSLPWMGDAEWIVEALRRPATATGNHVAFEQLLTPVVDDAEAMLWSGVGPQAASNMTGSARACLRQSLLAELSDLSAPALYGQFAEKRDYGRFVTDMKADGFCRVFDAKPVLLRLMASLTRQWIESSRELISRLDADLAAIRRDLLHTNTICPVATIDGDLSDPHNFGRSVRIVGFDDGSRVMYKPKDLCVDAAWHTLVDRLNRSAPLDLRAVKVLPRTRSHQLR
jgi:Domain of unknown function (DUF4135)